VIADGAGEFGRWLDHTEKQDGRRLTVASRGGKPSLTARRSPPRNARLSSKFGKLQANPASVPARTPASRHPPCSCQLSGTAPRTQFAARADYR